MPHDGHAHSHALDEFRHEHRFLGAGHAGNERKVWRVIGLCTAMMALEIGGGLMFGSMALVADGLHMTTHAAALLIAALAYRYARRHAEDERFTFGTGKLGDLAAFASAIVLAMIGLLIAWESVGRLIAPQPIAFDEAIPIAVLGLAVNLASAWLLSGDHHHDHGGHGHGHHHGHADQDLNHRAAFVHVLADAGVSVLAIVGLLAGRQLGWVWMDPLMGIVGAAVIANWAWGLVGAAGRVLLDMRPAGGLDQAVRALLETDGDRVADLHLWQVGPGHMAAVVSIVARAPQAPSSYKRRLAILRALCHVTVEVQAAG